MKKLATLLITILIGSSAYSQVTFTSNGKPVTSVKHGETISISVAVTPEMAKYDRLIMAVDIQPKNGYKAVRIYTSDNVGAALTTQNPHGEYYAVYKDKTKFGKSITARILGDKISSDFFSGYSSVGGVGIKGHDLDMEGIKNHDQRLDQYYQITVSVLGANAENVWSKPDQVYYDHYTFKEIIKFSNSLGYDFLELKTSQEVKNGSFSVSKVTTSGAIGSILSTVYEMKAYPNKQGSVDFQTNYFPNASENGNVQFLSWSTSNDIKKEINYTFLSFSSSELTLEDTKRELWNYVNVLATKVESRGGAVDLKSMFGKVPSFGKNKEEKVDQPQASSEKIVGFNVNWPNILGCFFICPGLATDLVAGEGANDEVKAKYPDVPKWEAGKTIGNLKVDYIDFPYAYASSNMSMDFNDSKKRNYFNSLTKDLYRTFLFVGESNGTVYVGYFSAPTKDGKIDPEMEKVKQEIESTFKVK